MPRYLGLAPTLAAYAAILLTAPAAALALTVVPGAITLSTDTGPAPMGDFFVHFYQDAAQTDFTSSWFDYDEQNHRLTLVTSVLDEGSDWYLVTAGQTFSWAGLTAGNYARLDYGVPVQLTGLEFYLAATTGRGFGDGNPSLPDRSVLGWVALDAVEVAGETRIVHASSAAAYGAASLVVGTLEATAIPEPGSTAALAGLCVLGSIALRRRRRA